MFWRLLLQSFRRQKRSKLLAIAAVTLGVAVATAMITIATDVGDKINRELRSFGANIAVYPEASDLKVNVGDVSLRPQAAQPYLSENDLPKIKSIFWRHNILAFAPFLNVQTTLSTADGSRPVELVGTYFSRRIHYGDETFTTGVHYTNPLWKVEGAWPSDDATSNQVLLGSQLAAELHISPGKTIQLDGRTVNVSGILNAGSEQDQKVWAPLYLAQEIAHQPGAVGSITVSALTKPEDAFARRDPSAMSPDMRDRWYCSPYANSIAFQLAEVIPHSRAEQIRQVAQSEGQVLSRIQGLMLLITLAALLAAALAVSASLATAIMERRREIGLMKAMGATAGSVAALFLAEGTLLGVIGGLAGFALGALLAKRIGEAVFGASMAVQPVLLPMVLLMAVLLVGLASAALIRRAARLDPAVALRGDL
jgi:putative ABC transport system permease protein